MSLRVFLSDLHLASGDAYANNYCSYNPGVHKQRLLDFLDTMVLAREHEIKDFVLLGDIFDPCEWPASSQPKSYLDIFAGNPEEMQRFKDIAASSINMFFVHGNHDMDLKDADLVAALPGIQVVPAYVTGRLHAEHGHMYGAFNAPDWQNDPAYGTPLGYFMTRARVESGESGLSPANLASYLDDLLEAGFTRQSLFASAIEGMSEVAGMTDNDEFVMPDGSRLALRWVKETYGRRGSQLGFIKAIQGIRNERFLGPQADRICKKQGKNVVIFGHNHSAGIDKDWWFCDDRIYANTGGWCCLKSDGTPKTPLTYVEVEKDAALPNVSVGVYEFEACGAPRLIGRESV